MKTFKKVLASALAAAMVVTAFPVANAEAATAPKLSATKATIYAGQSKTITVKNLTGAWKGAKVVSASSKKSVATVSRKGNKITVKAVKAGKATVTVKVTPKKGKAKSLKATITVKKPTLTVKAAATELAVGETTTITAKATPKKTVSFKSADETIATVDAKTGVVTAVKAGTVKITATAGKLSKDVDLTIKNVIFKDVKQTKANELTATIAGDTASLKTDSVAIKNTVNNIVYAVKSVTVDKADKTKVTITTFADMKDGKEYSVTIADTTKTFTATDNKIVAVSVTPTTVPYGSLSTISAIATDAQGVVLDEEKYNNEANITLAGKTAEFKITPAAGGYTTGAQLFLAKKDDVAKAKVVIKSGEYDATGKEINNVESGEVAITAVEPEAVTVSDFQVRIANAAVTGGFDKAKANTSLAIGDTGHAYFKFVDSKKADVTANYKISTSNASVLVMSDTTLTGSTQDVTVYGATAGTAYIIVKDAKDNVVATLPVTVTAKRTVDKLALSQTSFTLSTATSVGVESVKATVKDQYGDDTTAYNVAVENLTAPTGVALGTTGVDYTTTKGTITFTGANFTKVGTYAYKVTVTDANDATVSRSQVVTVNVAAPDTSKTAGYVFVLEGNTVSGTTVDATIKDTTAATEDVQIKIVKTYAGVKESYADASDVTVKKGNDNVAIATAAAASTFTAIEVNGNTATSAAVGTYVVSGKVGSVTLTPIAFTVKNDIKAVSFTQDKAELTTANAASKEAVVANAFKFKYADEDITVTSADVSSVDATGSCGSAGNNLFVKSCKIKVKVNATLNTWVTVTLNKTVKTIA